jgi:hypothetical protein
MRRKYRIKKTCGLGEELGGAASVRWRDESVALPDSLKSGKGRDGFWGRITQQIPGGSDAKEADD